MRRLGWISQRELFKGIRKGDIGLVKEFINKGGPINLFRDFGNGNYFSPLMYAVKNGQRDIVILLLDSGTNINAQSPYSLKTALMIAVEEGYDKIAALLIKRGADDLDNDLYKNALMVAIDKEDIGLIKMLALDAHYSDSYEKYLKLCRNKFQYNPFYRARNPFMYAIDKGDKEIINVLIDGGAKMEYQYIIRDSCWDKEEYYYFSALLYAIENGNRDIICLLIKRGANVNIYSKNVIESNFLTKKDGIMSKIFISDYSLNFIIMYFIEQGDKEILQLLITYGIDLTSPLLIYCIGYGNNEIIKLLINACANINDFDFTMPLFSAIKQGNKEIVEILIKEGADVNCFGDDFRNNTPLICAIEQGNKEIVEILIKEGADVNDCGYGKIPLICAIRQGNKEIVEILIKKGADINCPGDDFGNNTPLICAIEQGNKEIVRLLIKKGVNVNDYGDYNYDKKSPLMYAIKGGDKKTIELLIQMGAKKYSNINRHQKNDKKNI